MGVAHRQSREWCHRTGKQNFIKFRFFFDYYIFCIWYFFSLSSLPSHSFEINYLYHLHSRVAFTWSLSLTSTSSTLLVSHTLISSSMNSTTFSFLSLIFLYSYFINIPHYLPVIFLSTYLNHLKLNPLSYFPIMFLNFLIYINF